MWKLNDLFLGVGSHLTHPAKHTLHNAEYTEERLMMKIMAIKRVDQKKSRLPKHLKDGIYKNTPDHFFNRFKKKDPESVFNITPKRKSIVRMAVDFYINEIETGAIEIDKQSKTVKKRIESYKNRGRKAFVWLYRKTGIRYLVAMGKRNQEA